jgi:hypothetical protein
MVTKNGIGEAILIDNYHKPLIKCAQVSCEIYVQK